MGIASLQFIAFVAIAVILYRITPGKYQWLVLLGASICFYLSYSAKGIFVLLGTALLTYFLALRIEKSKDAEKAWLEANKKTVDKETRKAKREAFHRQQRRLEWLGVILMLGILFLTKYYGTMAEGINRSLDTRMWTAENILLPLGISYYSLQLIGYLADVSRDIIPAEKNPLKVILYGIFFLSIMQGPFNRYGDLMPQICREDRPRLDAKRVSFALLRITGGYIKKLCIADQVAIIANEVFSNPTAYTGLGCVWGFVCFAIQLYADFSGYMDIVIGIGELFSIQLPENFRQPFFARDISEFWRRWHITLGLWLKDYVFYPILKSYAFQKLGKKITDRFGKEAGRRVPTYLGMLILWTLIGTWHGAGIKYVFSVGILQFLYIFTGEMAEPCFRRMKAALHIDDAGLPWHIFQALRTAVLMTFAWIFFHAGTMADAFQLLRSAFAPDLFRGASMLQLFAAGDSALQGQHAAVWLAYVPLCALALFVLDLLKEKGVCIREGLAAQSDAVRLSVYILMALTLLVFGAYGSQYVASNFIYFEF